MSFLASRDAHEVIVVTESESVSTDFTDVTLVSDDTYFFSIYISDSGLLPGRLSLPSNIPVGKQKHQQY